MLQNTTTEVKDPSTASFFWAEDKLVLGGGVGEARLLRMYSPAIEPRPGSLRSDDLAMDGYWHFHDMHQIMCPFERSLILEVAGGKHLVPRNLAAWIPAGVPHRIILNRVRSISVFFPATMINDADPRARVVLLSRLMREMLLEATRWQVFDTDDASSLRKIFYEFLAGMTQELIECEAELFLPSSDNPQVKRVLEYTMQHMDLRLPEVCRNVGISERSLRRRLNEETGMTWETFRQRYRLIRAVTLLSETSDSVADIALQCGFECSSAFARAFREEMHQSPRAYRDLTRRSS